VLFLNDYLRDWGLITLALLAAVAYGFFYYVQHNARARLKLEQLLLRVPVAGGLIQAYCLQSAARTLALLLESGMPLPAALEGAASVMRYRVYAGELGALAARTREGGDIASGLRARSALFPDVVAHMVSAGEASGALAESLRYLSDYYANEAEERVKRLSSFVEPALMVVMGGVVGFVAVSMITPMYEITQHLNAR
jgi:type II secretory pathway component PulF